MSTTPADPTPQPTRWWKWALRLIGIGAGLLLALIVWQVISYQLNRDAIDSDVLVSRGLWRYHRGDPQAAVAAFDEAVALNAENSPAYFGRAQAHFMLGMYAEAATDYSMVLQLAGPYPEAYLGRGRATLALGDPAGALTDFEQALTLDPNLGLAYFERAQAYEALNDEAAALADYERFLQTYFLEDGYRSQALALIESLSHNEP